jgi:hypothetical protein
MVLVLPNVLWARTTTQKHSYAYCLFCVEEWFGRYNGRFPFTKMQHLYAFPVGKLCLLMV